MNPRSGFVLLATVTYAALTCVVVATACHLVTLIMAASYQTVNSFALADFYTAYDLIYYACETAPCDVRAWLNADTNGLIWSTDNGHAEGYVIVDDDLIYKKGIYNALTKQWHAATSSLIARNLHFDAVQIATQEGFLTGITCDAAVTKKPSHAWHMCINFSM